MTERRLLTNLISRLGATHTPSDFITEDLSQVELQAVLAAARVAPSADNAQTWRFVTVTRHPTKAALSEAVPETMADVIVSAPVVIVACGIQWLVTRTRREQPFVMIDVPIAITHMLLQAQELKLTFAWTLECREELVREALSIPEDVRIIAVLALGKPASDSD